MTNFKFSISQTLLATISVCCVAALQVSCIDAEASGTNNGVAVVSSSRMVNAIFNDLDSDLQTNENIKVVARIDHKVNASVADLALRPTKVIFFSNPRLGTPLMQSQQTAGIDLPQKIAVLERSEGSAEVLWNSASYLQQRHGLTAVDRQLTTIDNALSGLATRAAKNNNFSEAPATVDIGEGLIQRRCNKTFAEVVSALRTSLETNDKLTLVFELDHQANAALVGLELRPTHLFVFGNPAAGTPLMQAQQRTALDLPQKMLVYEDAEAVVRVAYNAPGYIAERHRISGQQQRLKSIDSALASLASTATE